MAKHSFVMVDCEMMFPLLAFYYHIVVVYGTIICMLRMRD